MSDQRSVDQLSLDELETIVEQRRRIERARKFAESGSGSRFRAVTVLPEDEREKTAPIKKPKRFIDHVLLLVEIAAVVGLVVILVSSLTNLQSLNDHSVQAKNSISSAPALPNGAQELPASSFPPANQAKELPGSSFPPEPAPAALGVSLKSVALLPVPTPGPKSPTRIVIPSINVDWPVVPGDSWEELKQGVGHHIGSANPGERGNLILSGHNDIYGEPFRDLELLDVGKEILVYTGSSPFRYVIKAKRVVLPTDLSVMSSSRDPIITLITCTPYRIDTHRLILIGELKPK